MVETSPVTPSISRFTSVEPEPLCCSARLMVTISCFVMAMVQVLLRLNLHFAIICFTADLPPQEEAKCPIFSVYNTTQSGAKVLVIPRDIRGHMLATFFYGFAITLIWGGLVSDKFGARLPFLAGSLVQVITTFLHPIFLNFSPYLFFPSRLVQGFSAGISSAPMYQLFSKWTLPGERPRLIGFAYAGFPLAGILVFPMCGLMCDHGYRGWESAFYLPGTIGALALVLFYFFVHDSPETSPRIAQSERFYLANIYPAQGKWQKKFSVPWTKILTSPAIYAYLMAHFAQIFNWQTVSINMPAFFKEVLHFELDENSYLSSLPYVSLLVTRLTIAVSFEGAHKWSRLSITRFRKNNHIVGCLMPAIAMIVIINLSEEYRYLSILVLAVGQGGTDLASTGGYYPTFLDMAPPYAGLLLGYADCIGFLGSIATSLIVGYLTTEGSRSGWDYVLYAQSGLLLAAMLVYEVWGTCEIQSWASENMTTTEIEEFKEIKSHISRASSLAVKF